MIPTKWSTTKPKQPWITRQIKHQTCRKQRAFKHAHLTNDPHDWSTYQDLKKLSQRECRSALTDMYLVLLMRTTMLQKGSGPL